MPNDSFFSQKLFVKKLIYKLNLLCAYENVWVCSISLCYCWSCCSDEYYSNTVLKPSTHFAEYNTDKRCISLILFFA